MTGPPAPVDEVEPFVTNCPVFRPTRSEFAKGFLAFVQGVVRDDPAIAMFKIIPPDGWKPTKRRPNLDKMIIKTPIQQLAFGKKGSYRCLLVEQKGLSVSDYRTLAESEERLPPPKCRNDYKLMERTFWKSLTINPPIYGADTPCSLFDEKISNGWSLRNLDDLLSAKNMPEIQGVTSPMTYFGMWKSFFAWHIEDADLYSVNFLHWGAPKIWYCVSPVNKARFEQMAQSLHPDLHHRCKGFLRHKDVLISPTMLKQYNIPHHQCKQEENEFVVLNAAAYHSGFNTGFNTAEAVNFALEEWVDVGRRAIPCTCDMDKVRIDMDLFDEEESTSEEAGSSGASGSGSGRSSDAARGGDAGGVGSSGGEGASECESDRTRASADAAEASTSKRRPSPGVLSPRKRLKSASRPGSASGSGAAGDKGSGKKDGAQKAEVKVGRGSSTSRAAAKPLRSAASKLSHARKQSERSYAKLASLAASHKPMVILNTAGDEKYFQMVMPLDKPAAGGGANVTLCGLKEGRDGLYRPSAEEFEEARSALVSVRTQLLDPGSNRLPGFKLLTLRSRILDTELL